MLRIDLVDEHHVQLACRVVPLQFSKQIGHLLQHVDDRDHGSWVAKEPEPRVFNNGCSQGKQP